MAVEIARGTSKELTIKDSAMEHAGREGDCDEAQGDPVQVIMEPEGVGSYSWRILRDGVTIASWSSSSGGYEAPGEGVGWGATFPPEALGVNYINSCPYLIPTAYIGDTKSTVTVPIDSNPGTYELRIRSSDTIITFLHSVVEFEVPCVKIKLTATRIDVPPTP